MEKIAARDHVASRSGAVEQAKESLRKSGFEHCNEAKGHNMKRDGRSADAFGQVHLVVSNAGIPIVASLNRNRGGWGMGKRVADLLVEPLQAAGVIMLAFAGGLLAAAIGARAADGPVRPQPTAERVPMNSVRSLYDTLLCTMKDGRRLVQSGRYARLAPAEYIVSADSSCLAPQRGCTKRYQSNSSTSPRS